MMMNSEICVCCGAEIPEGRQVCPSCENGCGSSIRKNKKCKAFSIFNFIHKIFKLVRSG